MPRKTAWKSTGKVADLTGLSIYNFRQRFRHPVPSSSEHRLLTMARSK
ncbi:MAG: hypothetical protein JOZ60_13100 [Verrucomicrobia bacterium]|nr:hypothetical protein [Verrucomicrobiota bacterium]